MSEIIKIELLYKTNSTLICGNINNLI